MLDRRAPVHYTALLLSPERSLDSERDDGEGLVSDDRTDKIELMTN